MYWERFKMKNQLLSLALKLLLSSAVGGAPDEQRAKEYLKRLEENYFYDRNMLPEGNGGPGFPVEVTVTCYILDIHQVDDTNMDFNVHMYFRQSWNDSRLAYDFSTDDLIFSYADHIWTPDLFFVEERKGSLHEITKPNIYLKIQPNGEVLYSIRANLQLSCPMDLRSFPHDTQKCTTNVESNGYFKKRLHLTWYPLTRTPLNYSKEITLPGFDIINISSYEKITPLLDRSDHYSSLQMVLTLKRKFCIFATRLYIPYIVLVIMASLSHWIRAEERGLRLALLLVILFLMTASATSINNMIPKASYTKASDVWIGFCTSLVFASVLEFIVVALIARRESEVFKTRSEILSMDPEAKDDKLNAPLSKVANLFDYRQSGMRNSLANRIDKVSRIVFPVIFLVFNIIYWSVY